ncbi:lanthionine synthetase LanC family protein [Ureibacillus sp. MALMAid1270]|uniref:lanthionine synthetase LanC family protein n=1 Tax=Ureibacillus sp. MALMAid1270 TaxID=3411629 RepID=UPI003BA81F24
MLEYRLMPLLEYENTSEPCAFVEYDLIYGLTGICTYLLSIDNLTGQLKEILLKIIDLIVYRAKFAEKGFYTTRNQHFFESERSDIFIECGLAHGVPGVLSMLCLAQKRGIQHPELHSSIKKLSSWLFQQITFEDNRYVIPYYIDENRSSSNAHFGWCYGMPGILIPLWTSLDVNEKDIYKPFFIIILKNIYKNVFENITLYEKGICHGIIGLIYILYKFCKVIYDKDLVDLLNSIIEKIPDNYLCSNKDKNSILNGNIGMFIISLSMYKEEESVLDNIMLLNF